MSDIIDLLRLESPEAAPRLLGWRLIVASDEGEAGGIIIETEAYRQDDPASHSFNGLTARNNALFREAGYIYVYRSYGLHAMLNLATGGDGEGQGVLIRAIEPTTGHDVMARRRGTDNPLDLARGPARLTQALGVKLEHNGSHLRDGWLRLQPPPSPLRPEQITASPRIGITRAVDKPWRFFVAGSPYVSGPSKLNRGPKFSGR